MTTGFDHYYCDTYLQIDEIIGNGSIIFICISLFVFLTVIVISIHSTYIQYERCKLVLENLSKSWIEYRYVWFTYSQYITSLYLEVQVRYIICNIGNLHANITTENTFKNATIFAWRHFSLLHIKQLLNLSNMVCKP